MPGVEAASSLKTDQSKISLKHSRQRLGMMSSPRRTPVAEGDVDSPRFEVAEGPLADTVRGKPRLPLP